MPPSKADGAENIRVAVRCRPMSKKEIGNKEKSIFSIKDGEVHLKNPKTGEPEKFAFDIIYGQDTEQINVYKQVGVPMLEKAFDGFNSTIFAYGQTGSGKSWSMGGAPTPELEGIIPRMNKALFDRIEVQKAEHPSKRFLVICSFFEIYNEVIRDLLDNNPAAKKNKGGLQVKEHGALGIYVAGLQEIVVDNKEKVVDLMALGHGNRTVASTQMNSESSRSHSVFTIKLHQKDAEDEEQNIFAKINLVDLAGSERQKGTGASGATLKEGANINKSLSALGNVINALVEMARNSKKKIFIPYRNSKLTRVLQESLGGNSVTSMVAALSPAASNFDETLSTLKYANRAKSIKLNAKKNDEKGNTKAMEEEIAKLKKMLAEQAAGGGGGGGGGGGEVVYMNGGVDEEAQRQMEEKYKKELAEMQSKMKETWEDKEKHSGKLAAERKQMQEARLHAAEKLQQERQQRWTLLEEKADVALVLKQFQTLLQGQFANAAAAGRGNALVVSKWMDAVEALRVNSTRVREQNTVLGVFHAAMQGDIGNWLQLRASFADKETPPSGGSSPPVKKLSGFKSVIKAVGVASAAAAQELYQQKAAMRTVILKLSHLSEEQKKIEQLWGEGSSLATELAEMLRVGEQELRQRRDALREETNADEGADGDLNVSAEGDGLDADASMDMLALDIHAATADGMTPKQRLASLDECLRAVELMARITGTHQLERARESIGEQINWMHSLEQSACQKVCQALEEEQATAESNEGGEVLRLALKELKKVLAQPIPDAGDVQPAAPAPKSPPKSTEPEWGEQQRLVIMPASGSSSGVKNKASGSGDALLFQAKFDAPRLVRAICTRGSSSTVTTTEEAEEDDYAEDDEDESATVAADDGSWSAAEVSEEPARTEEQMGKVIDWTVLLNKSSPTKLLERPPVRFLHDLFMLLCKLGGGGFGDGVLSEEEQDYANLGSKPKRIALVEKVIAFVTAQLQLIGGDGVEQRCTEMGEMRAKDVVVGQKCGKTNKLLQTLAIVAHAAQAKQEPAPSSAQKKKAKPRKKAEATTTTTTTSCWVAQYELHYRDAAGDGSWRTLKIDGSTAISANSSGDEALKVVRIPPQLQFVAKELKLVPKQWGGDEQQRQQKGAVVWEVEASKEVKGAAQGKPAARGSGASAAAAVAAAAAASTGAGSSEAAGAGAELHDRRAAMFGAVDGGLSVLGALLEARMKVLQRAADQSQLDGQRSLAQSQQENLQMKEQIRALQDQLRAQDEEKAEEEAARVRQQARVTELEARCNEMNDRVQQVEGAKVQAELIAAGLEVKLNEIGEKFREAENNITICTEERDLSREAEVTLHGKLAETQEDLEALQDSYAWLTEAKDKLADQVCDYEEKMEQYEAMADMRRQSMLQQEKERAERRQREEAAAEQERAEEEAREKVRQEAYNDAIDSLWRSIIKGEIQRLTADHPGCGKGDGSTKVTRAEVAEVMKECSYSATKAMNVLKERRKKPPSSSEAAIAVPIAVAVPEAKPRRKAGKLGLSTSTAVSANIVSTEDGDGGYSDDDDFEQPAWKQESSPKEKAKVEKENEPKGSRSYLKEKKKGGGRDWDSLAMAFDEHTEF
jgi:kinesin family protein 1/kinesin family protein 3/17